MTTTDNTMITQYRRMTADFIVITIQDGYRIPHNDNIIIQCVMTTENNTMITLHNT